MIINTAIQVKHSNFLQLGRPRFHRNRIPSRFLSQPPTFSGEEERLRDIIAAHRDLTEMALLYYKFSRHNMYVPTRVTVTYDGSISENCHFFVVQRSVLHFILVGSQIILPNTIQNLKNTNFTYTALSKNRK